MEAGRNAPRYQDMALLYPRSRTLQDALCEYFIVVVHICQHAVKFFNKNTLSRISSAVFDSTLHQFQTDMNKWATLIRDEVTWLNSQVVVDESKQNSAFRKMVTKFKDSSGRHHQLEAKLRLLDACSTLDYQTPWKQARKRGVATWFTTALEYQLWKQQTLSSTLLCTGKLGSGKTTLMASMVDDLASTSGKGNLVYFFCRYDIAESLTARAIFGSLTRQLLCQQTIELTRLQQDYASQIMLDCDMMLEILQTLLSHNEKYYILIDGLDECPQGEIDTIVGLLQNLQRALSTLICISYREEARSPVEKLSKGFVRLHTLKAPEMNPDIEAYIDAELQERLQSDKLSIGDPTIVLSIREALLKGAQGMFVKSYCICGTLDMTG
jgi:Cdc6-like AAA superfamily ATPase